MNQHFPDLTPFPGAASDNERVRPAGNKPPLEEAIVADFMEGLRLEPGLLAKVEELVAAGDRAGPLVAAGQLVPEAEDKAGRYGDFIRMCTAAAQKIEAEREKHNRPLLTAQRTLKARSDSFTTRLLAAVGKVRAHLNAYAAEQERIRQQRQHEAEEQAAAARQAAEAAARRQAEEAGVDPSEVEPIIEVAAPVVEAPVARGDFSRVGTTTVWKHEIESVRKVPDAYLKHPKVVEALDKVIAAAVRGGARDIKGVRIWDEKAASVR